MRYLFILLLVGSAYGQTLEDVTVSNTDFTIESITEAYTKITPDTSYLDSVYVREDGAVEWEFYFKERPKSGVITVPIESRGLTFFYQDTLTDEDKVAGAYRPDSVIGSYAVYYSNAGYDPHRLVGFGKAYHIYRPRAWDSKYDTSWVDMKIDTIGGTLRLSISEDWLDRAAYPVTVDPTFGMTSQPGTSASVSAAISFTVTSGYSHIAGTYDTIVSYSGWFSKGTGSNQTISMVAYNTNGNAYPVDRIETAVSMSITESSPTLFTTSGVLHPLVASDTFVVAFGDEDGNVDVYYDATPGVASSRSSGSTTLDATWSGGGTLYNMYGIYATYREETPVPSTCIIIIGGGDD